MSDSLQTPKPFAPAAQRNQQPILDVMRNLIANDDRVFEFGSGTGQHACHISAALPGIYWQPSDLADKLPGIRQWIIESTCKNISDPIALDLAQKTTPEYTADICFTANTLHIVSWQNVINLFRHTITILGHRGSLLVYGPININGEYTSEGNRQFDAQLQSSNPESGIRDLEALDTLAAEHGMQSVQRITMPANNHLLHWSM